MRLGSSHFDTTSEASLGAYIVAVLLAVSFFSAAILPDAYSVPLAAALLITWSAIGKKAFGWRILLAGVIAVLSALPVAVGGYAIGMGFAIMSLAIALVHPQGE